jgi:hypothetical protein
MVDKEVTIARRRLLGFGILQLAFWGGVSAWASVRWARLEQQWALPQPRNEPLRVGPQYNIPEIVTDEQLAEVLWRLRPQFRVPKPKINFVDHALRCWGAQATFADAACLSGEEMRQLLTDHQRFAEAWGAETAPLLIDTDEGGVRVRVQEGQHSSSHYDHVLGCLAETGTPLDYPLRTPRQQTTVRAMFDQCLRDFSLNQAEYEWSAMVFALYMPHVRRWRTREGQEITFDRLAERIMRQELPQGVCLANHRMHTLVVFLRVDEQQPLLSAAMRQRVTEYLQNVTQLLVQNQHPEGYWTHTWPGYDVSSQRSSAAYENTLANWILATGHPMEWWALAPEPILPPREVLVRAGQWLVRTISEMPEKDVQEGYGFLSHAAHALALWRQREPAQVPLPQAPSRAAP